MDRRAVLKLLAAGGSLAALPRRTSASGAVPRPSASHPESPEDGFQRDDWVPHHTLDIEKDGTTTLTITLEGPNAPTSITLNSRRTTVLEIVEGEDALSSGQGRYSWDVETASSVAFRIRLGEEYGRGMKTRVFEDSIASDVNELVQVNTWPDGPDTLPAAYRFTYKPPSGWSVVSAGERVAPDTYDLNPAVIQYGQTIKSLFAVGDFEVHERLASETTIRAAELPAANHPKSIEEILNLLAEATPVMEDMYGYGKRYPWAVILTPKDFESGGFPKDDSIFFGDDAAFIDDGGSGFLGEQAATYDRAGRYSDGISSRWYIDGSSSYVSRYALYEIGRIDHERLIRMFRAWVTGAGQRNQEDPLGRPVSSATSYQKGTAIFALLDMEIRSRTDGEHDIGAWISEIADQRILQYRGEARHLIRDDEARPLLYEITGVDFTEFYDRFVHGSEFPENFFAEKYSLKNPQPLYAAFEYPGIEMMPQEPKVEETVEVTVEMRNDADRTQQRTLDLVVDRESVAETDVRLEPGASTTVTLEHMFTSPGEHVVRVPPAYTETVTVDPTPTPTQTDTPGEATPSPDGQTAGPSASPTSEKRTTTLTATTSPGQPGLGPLGTIGGILGSIAYVLHRDSSED